MNHSIILASATSTGLAMSAVSLAGEGNDTTIVQNGTGNAAVITQDEGNDNLAGSAADALNQSGTDNRLVIDQSGDSKATPNSSTVMSQAAQ